MLYSAMHNYYVKVDSLEKSLYVGRWLILKIKGGIDETTILTSQNASGFHEMNVGPTKEIAHIRFFPLKNGFGSGECVLATKLEMTQSLDGPFWSPVFYNLINMKHVIDPYRLLERNRAIRVVVELQASPNGWELLQILPENRCDQIPYSLVPYGVEYAEFSNLQRRMAMDSGFRRSSPEIEKCVQIMENPVLVPRLTRNVQEPTESVTDKRNEPVLKGPPLGILQKTPDGRENVRNAKLYRESDILSISIEGTSGLEPREIPSKEILNVWRDEGRCRRGSVIRVAAVMTQKTRHFWIFYSLAPDVIKILAPVMIFGDIELSEGEMIGLDVQDRARKISDKLVQKEFSHIAERPVELPDREFKKLRSSLRSFAGLLQVFLTIDMSIEKNIERVLDKNEEFYRLKAENECFVIADYNRIHILFETKLSADCKLELWAIRRVHRIRETTLYMDRTTDCTVISTDGTRTMLP